MDENKNAEMSVDELLAKLKASLAGDTEEEPAPKEETEVVAEEETVEEAVAEEEEEAPAVEEVPAAIEVEEPEDEEAPEVGEAIEEPVEEEPAEESEAAEEATEEPTFAPINEEDIFAAWGIDRAEAEQQKTEIFDAVSKADAEMQTETASVNTKVYYIARVESKEEYALRKQTEAQKETVDYDRTDYSLIKQAMGMEQPDADSEAQEFYAMDPEKEDTAEMTLDVPHAEFTYQRQREDIAADYKAASRTSGIQLIFTAVITVLLFLLECLPSFGVALPEALNAEYYPVVYAMAVMQLAWFAGAFSYREIANGFLGLLKYRMSAGSVLGLLLLGVTVCDIVVCALGMSAPVYNFSVVFAALLLRTFEYLDIRRETMAFTVASSTQTKKYVAVHVPSEEIEGLEEYTGEDSSILRTEKCSFVENYFARTEKRSDAEVLSNKYLVPIILAASVIALVISAVKGGDAATNASVFSAILAVGMPVLVLMSSAFPLYKAACKLSHRDSAIIGETSVEEYAGTTMICFDDADAFPSYGVALENLRIYGKGDIETIIEQMDAVFSKLGGPLRHVFSLMVAECPKPYNVKIAGVYEDGICASVNGSKLYIGTAEYMEKNGIRVLDTTTEIGGKYFSTMYLAEENALRAKFFIRYTLDGSFETIIKKLARRGIASVILTGDSNINDELLARSLDISKLPVKVVRRNLSDNTVRGDRADSGVVSAGAVGDLVSTVTMCDRLSGVLGTMRAVRIASVVICAILAIGATLLGMHTSLVSLYVLLYHLFWLVPAWLVTKINL